MATTDVPVFIREGELVYDDPARSVYVYDGCVYLADPEVPDGESMWLLSEDYVKQFMEDVFKAMAEGGIRVIIPLTGGTE